MAEDDIEKRAAAANPVALQRELFALFDALFTQLAGKPAHAFSTWDDALAALRGRAKNDKIRAQDATEARERLLKFYSTNATVLYRIAKRIAGSRLVLGGGGNYFLSSHLSSVQKVILYTDTVLIPDSVFERIQSASKLEHFDRVEEIRSAYFLLALKPLVDTDLPYPAIFVFPSFEKALEENDATTQQGIDNLISVVSTHHLGVSIQNLPELFQYASGHADRFLEVVAQRGLFIPPGAETPSQNLSDAIEIYRKYINERRNPEVAKVILQQPNAVLVANAIAERLMPQYHLFENSQELRAHPLLALPAHEHYFRIAAAAYEGRVERLGHIPPEAKAAIAALNDPSFVWLGNVPMEDIVRLRKENANEEFRRFLDTCIEELDAATLEDSGRVAGEVAKKLAGMLAAHQKEARKINEDYQRKYTKLAAPSILTAAAAFIPALATVIGLPVAVPAALGFAGKYASDKLDELDHKKRQARSLLGVLSSAKKGVS